MLSEEKLTSTVKSPFIAEAGADVVIVEKQGITGGSTTRSGGKVLAAGTSWQTKQNFEDTPEQMYDYLMGFSKGLINESLVISSFPLVLYTNRTPSSSALLVKGTVI